MAFKNYDKTKMSSDDLHQMIEDRHGSRPNRVMMLNHLETYDLGFGLG
jgi:hypothetical protein